MLPDKGVLVVNAGSSSIKISIYSTPDTTVSHTYLEVTGIGLEEGRFFVRTEDAPDFAQVVIGISVDDALNLLGSWIRTSSKIDSVGAVGHRIVHGGTSFTSPQVLNPEALEKLRELEELDPEHLPLAIKCIELMSVLIPDRPQVGCFDTAFYSELPRIAQMVAVPRAFESMGVRRYGFHGLSYGYLLTELSRCCGEQAAMGRVIFAHMGSGVSLTATKDGKPVDTTMGFTPASGVMMSTRSGDVDPGLSLYLQKRANLSSEQVSRIFNKQSGLLGVSETSADMYQLLQNEMLDERAKEAVDLFCYQVKKAIGALSAVLGGLDTIVFSGGMGENAPKIRQRVLDTLGYLGVELDDERNRSGDERISGDHSRVGVHVLRTDENQMIVRQVQTLLIDQFRG